jgi:hypothetical protein
MVCALLACEVAKIARARDQLPRLPFLPATTPWDVKSSAVFIDCNPSFSIYPELAMSASDRLIIPFSADGSSKRAARAVLALLYGI